MSSLRDLKQKDIITKRSELRILYSKDSVTYYTNFEDIMRNISIFIYNKELQLFYSFALCITFNSKPC